MWLIIWPRHETYSFEVNDRIVPASFEELLLVLLLRGLAPRAVMRGTHVGAISSSAGARPT